MSREGFNTLKWGSLVGGSRAFSRERGARPAEKKEFRFACQLFRILFFRRVRLHLLLSVRSCRCGRPFDVLVHHRAACGTAGDFGHRGWVFENVAARGRVRVNVLVRDMDFHEFNQFDGRWLEVVDGLPLWTSAQFAIDTTMVSPFEQGQVRLMVSLLTLPEFGRPEDTLICLESAAGPVFGTEVGGRWSTEAATFLCSLKARDSLFVLGGSVRTTWLRNIGLRSSQSLRRVALGRFCHGGVDGPTPSMKDVLGDARFG